MTARDDGRGDGRAVDDEATWALILTDEWGPLVREAVVRRVEDATRGDRARLVRTVLDPDHAPPAWVEHVHDLVLEAVQVETGADLEELGSQSSWAVYEDVWDALRARWSGGGRLLPVPVEAAARVAELVACLPVSVAAAAGADTSTIPARPLRVDDVVLVDAEGLFAWIAGCDPASPEAVARVEVDALLALLR